MDSLHVMGGDTLTLEWEKGDTLELIGEAIIVLPTGGGGVNSVNGQTGDVVLAANDVGADASGSAQSVSDALQPQITTNTDAVAMLTALLSALQASKADLTYVNQQIANLVNSDAQTLATIQAITAELAENEDLLEALDQTVANRVRFDVATQGLTALQKYNARTNIGAEEVGTAVMLISQITAASIGAVTASQLAPVATSGSYNDLTNKPNITGTLLTGLTTVAASAISATDSVIGAFAKLQASVNAKQNSLPTTGTAGQFLAHDMTFKTPSGGGGDGIVWTEVGNVAPAYWQFGFSDGTGKLSLGRDTSGNIYIKGVIRCLINTLAKEAMFNLSSVHQLKGYSHAGTSTFYNVRYNELTVGSNPANVNHLMISQSSGLQAIHLSDQMITGRTYQIPQQCLGLALNP